MNDHSEGLERYRAAKASMAELDLEMAEAKRRRVQIDSAVFIASSHLVSVAALVCSVYLIVRGHPWFGLGFLIAAVLVCPHRTGSGGRQ